VQVLPFPERQNPPHEATAVAPRTSMYARAAEPTLPAPAGVRAGDDEPSHAPSSGAPHLLVQVNGVSQTVALPWTGELLIGRAETCQIVISDPAVSRVHTRINTIRGEAAVTDVGGQEGTRVNGKSISETEALVSGDVIAVCGTEITYRDAGASNAEQPVPLLTQLLLDRACDACRKPRMTLDASALERLLGANSSSNVRELERAMRYVAATLPREKAPGELQVVSKRQPLQEEIAELTARRITEALASTGGNQTHAARLIGMPLRTFISKLKDLRSLGLGEADEKTD
jgi:pSer/pThr/pTyr-binding forkhead associated (FHA) protein